MLKQVLLSTTLSLAAFPALAQQTEVTIQYPYPEFFENTHKQIAEEFSKQNPDIKLTFRAAYESYEDATQKVLREAITGQTPDITFQGLNRIRTLVDRDLAQPLDAFIADEPDMEADGFHAAMYDIGAMNGKIYGLPFAISLPILYLNVDLVKQAGGDPANPPKTWDEVIDLAKKIKALDANTNGISYAWDVTGNWLWQAPVFALGGSMLTSDESKVAFDGPEGKAVINMLGRLVTEAGMPNLSQPDMRAAFAAGRTGMLATSTADLAKITQMIDSKFELKTVPFPDVVEGKGRLPAGGNLAVILAEDPEKKAAAWKVLKFWTGPEGSAIMARTTGYMPANKTANEVHLKDFYTQNPNNYTAVSQLPLMTNWYAFPGENGLKITDVIKDHIATIVTGQRADEQEQVLTDMAADVQALLPNK